MSARASAAGVVEVLAAMDRLEVSSDSTRRGGSWWWRRSTGGAVRVTWQVERLLIGRLAARRDAWAVPTVLGLARLERGSGDET